jgi:hypothetical protein
MTQIKNRHGDILAGHDEYGAIFTTHEMACPKCSYNGGPAKCRLKTNLKVRDLCDKFGHGYYDNSVEWKIKNFLDENN